MEVKLNKKLHRYLVQNSLILEIGAMQDTAEGVRTRPCGNTRYTFLTPNPYSLTDADFTSSNAEVTKTLNSRKHIPFVVSTLLESLAKKGFKRKLKKKGHTFFSVFGLKLKITLSPLERVI